MSIPARAELDRLCGPHNWRIVGVSALVYDQENAYLEIARPVAWHTDDAGVTMLPLVCVGGHLEPGEGLLDCLAREAHEEIGVALRPVGAPSTRLIFQDRLCSAGFTDGDDPLPWFYTIGPNRLPDAAADVGFLVIVTYLAQAIGKPALGDIFGLVAIPRDALRAALPAESIPWQALCRQHGATFTLAGELPPAARCMPSLSARSMRLLLESEHPADGSLPGPPVIDSLSAG